MKYSILVLLSIFLTFGFLNTSLAQGCSDAGICTAGSFSHNKEDVKYSFMCKNQVGVGEQNVISFVSQIEFNARLTQKKYLQVRVPYVFTSGNLGSTNGVGDVSFSYTYSFYKRKYITGSFLVGFKTSTGRTDLGSIKEIASQVVSLPMSYQPGLGSRDWLFGVDLRFKESLKLAIGMQIPAVFVNKNTFDTAISGLSETSRQYFSSKNLIRSSDLVLQLEKSFKIKKKWIVKASFVPIIHLNNDIYVDSRTKRNVEVMNSSGTTLNGVSSVGYNISDNFQFFLNLGAPFVTRKARPDGLTRKFVIGLDLKYYIL